MIFDNVNDALLNCHFVIADKKSEPHGKCASAEGMYRSPKDDEERVLQSYTKDFNDGWRCNDIIQSLEHPLHRKILAVSVYNRCFEECDRYVLNRALKRKHITLTIDNQQVILFEAKQGFWKEYSQK